MSLLLPKSREELENLRVVDIKDLIKRAGFGFDGNTRKADLINYYLNLLISQTNLTQVDIKDQLNNLTVVTIKELLRRGGVSFSNKERKADLIDIYVQTLGQRR